MQRKQYKRSVAGSEPFQSVFQPELYVFLYDPNVTIIAHADNPSMVGANYHNKTNMTGRPFRDLIVEGALQNGTGWEDYLYSSPAETGLYWKSAAYWLVTGSDGRQYMVFAGLYKTEEDFRE